MTRADQYVEFATIRQIELQGVATWILRQLVQTLRDLETDIISDLFRIDPTGTLRARYRQERQEKLLQAVKAKLREVYRELENRIGDYMQETADIQEEHERKVFAALWGLDLTPIQFAVGSMLILGATIGDHLDKVRQDALFRISKTIRNGTINSTPAGDIADTIKGRGPMPTTPEIETQARGIEIAVRTGMDQIANDIPGDLVEATPEEPVNPEEPEGEQTIRGAISPHGWQQISILDNRTSQICQDYAFRLWDANYKPIGHDLPYNGGPPRHNYCRSRIVMVFLDDPLPTRQTFDEWLAKMRKPRASKTFGEKKMRLYSKELITSNELIRQHDRPISPEELRGRDPLPPEST